MKKITAFILACSVGGLVYVGFRLARCTPQGRFPFKIELSQTNLEKEFYCQFEGDYWLEVYVSKDKFTPSILNAWESPRFKKDALSQFAAQAGIAIKDIGIGYFGGSTTVSWDPANEYEGFLLGTVHLKCGKQKLALNKATLDQLRPLDWLVINFDRNRPSAGMVQCIKNLFTFTNCVCCLPKEPL